MTQVSQKLWKAWVLAFVYMSLMGGCRELKPVSAAVQTALQIYLVIVCSRVSVWPWSHLREIWFPIACYFIGIIVSMSVHWFPDQTGWSSEWTVGQLTIHEWGWQKPQTWVMIWRPASVGHLPFNTCMYFSRYCYTSFSLSSLAQLDSGCVVMCIYACQSLKIEGGTMVVMVPRQYF